MILQTDFGYFEHKDLLATFCRANEVQADFIQDQRTIDGVMHSFLTILVLDSDSEQKLTWLGFKHAGILNMLHDYLKKCNVDTFEPITVRNQRYAPVPKKDTVTG
jgi:hypothetical protein